MTDPLGAASGRAHRMAIGRRGVVVLALLTAGGLAAASSSTWIEVLTWTPLAEATVAVSGTRAAPTVGAAAFVVATGAVALALARGRGVVASLGIALGGILAAVSTARVLAEPEAVATTAARAEVGVGVTAGSPAVTVAPWIALAMGVLAVALAGIALLASRGWSRPTARHGTAGETEMAGEGDPTDQWDALSRGEDPTA